MCWSAYACGWLKTLNAATPHGLSLHGITGVPKDWPRYQTLKSCIQTTSLPAMFSLGSLFPFELPSLRLPTLSIPANIQRRFISFVLRRSLGRFVRPGQLDDHQVDSQIGNGSIEISQIELSDEVSDTFPSRQYTSLCNCEATVYSSPSNLILPDSVIFASKTLVGCQWPP